jgi:predicted Zn-dependent protease
MKKYISLFFVFVLLAGCATVEYTNRKSMILIDQQQEMSLGAQGFKEVMEKEKVSGNVVQSEMIKRVGARIAAVANRPDFKWEFVLIDNPKTVNAFCLPGGKVVFYTGILPLCKDENGIATVMSHEVAHAIARHGAERVSQQIAAGAVQDVLSEVVTNQSPAKKQAILLGYGLATNVGVILPFSREHEYEADRIGLILMAKAGYDPRTAVDFWQRMAAQANNKYMPEFISTHPADAKRIEAIRKELPEALTYSKGITPAPKISDATAPLAIPVASAGTARTRALRAQAVAPRALPVN